MVNELRVRVKDGYLVASEAPDPEFPGIDIEFVPDEDTGEYTNPRILFERPVIGPVRALVWAEKNDEDYTKEIVFE